MNTLVIKRGDTLLLDGSFKQTGGSAMDLTGFTVEVSIIDENDRTVVVIGETVTTNRSVVVNDIAGTFRLMMKDTEVLKNESYWMDFKYTTVDGIEQSSKSVKLKVKNKLV